MRADLAAACLMILTLASGCFGDGNGTSGPGGGATTTSAAGNPTTAGSATTALTTTTAMTTTTSMATTSAGTTGPTEVVLLDNAFVPSPVNITRGSTIEFLNQGGSSHTVTIHRVGDAATVWVKDTTLATGDMTTYTFDTATTYHVWCKFHGSMTSDMAMVVNVS